MKYESYCMMIVPNIHSLPILGTHCRKPLKVWKRVCRWAYVTVHTWSLQYLAINYSISAFLRHLRRFVIEQKENLLRFNWVPHKPFSHMPRYWVQWSLDSSKKWQKTDHPKIWTGKTKAVQYRSFIWAG